MHAVVVVVVVVVMMMMMMMVAHCQEGSEHERAARIHCNHR